MWDGSLRIPLIPGDLFRFIPDTHSGHNGAPRSVQRDCRPPLLAAAVPCYYRKFHTMAVLLYLRRALWPWFLSYATRNRRFSSAPILQLAAASSLLV